MDAMTQELESRAEVISAPVPDGNRNSLGRFVPGNQMTRRGSSDKIGAAVFKRALELMSEIGDDANPLVRLMKIYLDPATKVEQQITAADKLARLLFGTRSNVAINLEPEADPDTDLRAQRLNIALSSIFKRRDDQNG
jgi:hypothetical protein